MSIKMLHCDPLRGAEASLDGKMLCIEGLVVLVDNEHMQRVVTMFPL